jgi:ankyrin repeat protein
MDGLDYNAKRTAQMDTFRLEAKEKYIMNILNPYISIVYTKYANRTEYPFKVFPERYYLFPQLDQFNNAIQYINDSKYDKLYTKLFEEKREFSNPNPLENKYLFDWDMNGDTLLTHLVKKQDSDSKRVNIIKQILLSANDGKGPTDIEINTKHIYTGNSAIIYTGMGKAEHNATTKEIIDLLIENGADINATNKEGKTAYALAIENKNDELAEYLLFATIRFCLKNPLIQNTITMNENAMNALNKIPKGKWFSQDYTPTKSTLLMIAVTKNKKDFVNILLNGDKSKGILGATPEQVNLTNMFGYSAIIYTGMRNKDDNDTTKQIIDLLIAKGADINAKNNAGKTAYDLAIAIDNNNDKLADYIKTRPGFIKPAMMKNIFSRFIKKGGKLTYKKSHKSRKTRRVR